MTGQKDLAIGKDAYGFIMTLAKNETNLNLLTVDLIFTENNHVQDEIASAS
jgi:hypothetical protein